jgi:chromosome segregation ATPase
MSRINELYQSSENLFKENKVEIETTENTIAYLKSDKAKVEEELAEAKKQVELLRSYLKKTRETLKNETLKLKNLSKEHKVLAKTIETLKPTPVKSGRNDNKIVK